MALREEVVRLASASALVASSEGTPRATVLLLHGLGASKEVQRPEAHSLAEHGFRAVTLDAVGHGERRLSDFDERFRPDRAETSYFELVQQTAAELPSIVEALSARGWTQDGLGACGISMGGAILFGAIARGVRFDAACTIVASPRWKSAPHSPHAQLEQFWPTPLLMQTAGADRTVPPEDARELFECLSPLYGSTPRTPSLRRAPR